MFGFFFQKHPHPLHNNNIYPHNDINSSFITTDIHSHLIPNLDDGVQSLAEATEIIQYFIAMGYTKLITTPHIMSDYYKNTPEKINRGLEELKKHLQQQKLPIEIEAAAEYYVDEVFMKKLADNEKMLTFGNNYLLFETSFINKPFYLLETIFQMKASGYRPVFAHPERYQYIQDDFKFLEEIAKKDVLLQINLNSLTGYYGKSAQKTVEKIIDSQMLSFAGSDCHGQRHLNPLQNLKSKKYYEKLAELKLLNNTL